MSIEAMKQEPVAWDGDCALGHCGSPAGCESSECCRADYTAPPQRQPLTQSEVVEGFCKTPHMVQYVSVFDAGVRFAERKHKIGSEA